MLLAIDVGNTNTVLGLYRLEGEKPELAAHWRVTTHRSQTADEYGVLFVNLFEMNGLATSQVHHIIISSVVPPVESTLRQVCETYFHTQPLFVEPGIKTGMPVLQDNSGGPGRGPAGERHRRLRALRRPVHRGGLRHGDHLRRDLGQGRVPGRGHCARAWASAPMRSFRAPRG